MIYHYLLVNNHKNFWPIMNSIQTKKKLKTYIKKSINMNG